MLDIINTGIIGFGLSGKKFHAPLLDSHYGFNIKKIVERYKNESVKLYPNAEKVNCYKEIFRDPDIDLVVVATPNNTHFQIVKDVIEAGKHVVVEKPFTTTSMEADELIEFAETRGINIFVFHSRRWDGDFMTIREILKNNLLGDITEYEAHFDRYKPDLKSEKWKEDESSSGGILYDLGSHLIDQALVLFGVPIKLFADIKVQRPGSTVDDCIELNLYYPGFKATLKAGMMVRDSGPQFIIHGNKGSFVKYGTDPQEGALRKGELPQEGAWGIDNPEKWGLITCDYNGLNIDGRIETEAGNYHGFYNNVYNVLVNGHQQIVNPEEARNVIRVIELARLSNNEQKVVDCIW